MVDIPRWYVDVDVGNGDGAHERNCLHFPCRRHQFCGHKFLFDRVVFGHPAVGSVCTTEPDGHRYERSGVVGLVGSSVKRWSRNLGLCTSLLVGFGFDVVDVCGWYVDVDVGDGDGAHERNCLCFPSRGYE
jgi:hypothetical protein